MKQLIFISLSSLIIQLFVSCESEKQNTVNYPNNSYTDFDSLFPIRKNGKWGFINNYGKTVIEPRFNEEPILNRPGKQKFILASINNKHELISANGKAYITGYARIKEINKDFFVAIKNKKSDVYQLINDSVKMLVSALDSVYTWNESYATVYKKGEKFGFILANGKVIAAKQISEKVALEKRINFRADTSFGEWENETRSFYVFSKNHGGFIKRNKGVILGPYKFLTNFSEGLAAVANKTGWFYIDTSGRKMIPGPFNQAKPFHNGIAIVDNQNLINKSGKRLGHCNFFIQSDTPKDGLYLIDAGMDTYPYGKGLMNSRLELIVSPMEYDEFGTPSNGMIAVGRYQNAIEKRGKKWGFIDTSGKLVIELKYDEVKDFIEGYAPVYINSKWGMIDRSEKTLIPSIYNSLSHFHLGMARAEINGKLMYLDKQGKVVWKEE